MKVTCEISDYSKPQIEKIKVNSVFAATGHIELEVDGKRYEVDGKELISAIKRCTLDCFER